MNKSIKIPDTLYEKIAEIVEDSDGLFSDESEYVTHCIIHYNRNYRG